MDAFRIHYLPPELRIQILSKLDYLTLIRYSRSSRGAYQLVRDPYLWHLKVQEEGIECTEQFRARYEFWYADKLDKEAEKIQENDNKKIDALRLKIISLERALKKCNTIKKNECQGYNSSYAQHLSGQIKKDKEYRDQLKEESEAQVEKLRSRADRFRAHAEKLLPPVFERKYIPIRTATIPEYNKLISCIDAADSTPNGVTSFTDFLINSKYIQEPLKLGNLIGIYAPGMQEPNVFVYIAYFRGHPFFQDSNSFRLDLFNEFTAEQIQEMYQLPFDLNIPDYLYSEDEI